MAKIAILIPSRNEAYLYPTIRDCFAKAEGEIEIVVTLEGYWPTDWKSMADTYPNLHTVHHGEPLGLRAAVNAAAASAISRGAKYLLKLDAHCMLDEGFDTKLQADMESNWIVVPRRKRLDAEIWTIKDVGKPDIDYHYLSFPDDPKDFGGKGLNGKVWDERIRERLNKPEYDLDDEMSSQGSAWFMMASYFQQLELMDQQSYGPFWNEFQECGLKCWLSGGQVKINKKTWYAHLHKGREYRGEDGRGGRGYNLPESWLKQGAAFTKNWIYNEAWSKQTKPFSWLIEHFWHVPSWPENWEEVLYAERKPRVVQGYEIGVDVANGKDRIIVHDGKGNPAKELVIISATYGVIGDLHRQSIDITQRVRELAQNDWLDIIVNNSTLTPGKNPFRGKKKRLLVRYSYNGGEVVDIARDEKDWLIIGQAQREMDIQLVERQDRDSGLRVEKINSTDDELHQDGDRGTVVGENEFGLLVNWDDGVPAGRVPKDKLRPVQESGSLPRTSTALNDYLIRKFSISPQRLRGPMPIELRDFHRNDLAQLFAELGFKRGAEIGVAEGRYSEVLLKSIPNLELALVDPWHHYSMNPQGKSMEKHRFAFEEMKRRTAGYDPEIIPKLSSQAACDFDSDYFDFVYVDANHLFDYAMEDLILWSRNTRSGGIVSGDDYYELDQKRWKGGGVVDAVQAYVKAHRIPIWYTFSGHKSYDYMWVRP